MGRPDLGVHARERLAQQRVRAGNLLRALPERGEHGVEGGLRVGEATQGGEGVAAVVHRRGSLGR
ncbi:hypothetical protein [Cellulosimicrobium sp. Marseille-Q4280]|uniref:hypothetical protein n=1 Tax=Cellulosimicrobium sp. Marseille-Q4280 TaxID=2937992 RepID=UPI00203E4507|nr:hypothetical protein [Cellulosimicrobium sp. Marseille-Q4280]